MARALAVSGGSSKGAFAVGVAQRLRDRFGMTFDLVAGTSTGAVLAPFVVTNQLDRAEELYTAFSTDDCFVRQDAVTALQTGFLLDTAPLAALLDRFYDAALFDAVRRAVDAGARLYLAAVCLETGALTYFHVGPPPRVADGRATRELGTRADLVEAVLASASQPVIMRLPTIDGRRYCDGGVRETAPIRVVIDNGATDVVAVVLSPAPDGEAVPVGSGLVATAGRTLDLLLTEIVRDDIVEAQAAGSARVTLVRPRAELIEDALEFTRADMRRMVRLGLERVDELFPDGTAPIA
jgi:predicted acylesterase/phospholipase RssA